MIKIIAACGAGMGTSMMIRLKLNKILKKLGVAGEVESMSVGQARSMVTMADIIFTSLHLVSEFNSNSRAKIFGIRNLIDEEEIEAVLRQALETLGVKVG